MTYGLTDQQTDQRTCFNLTSIRERRASRSFISSSTAVILFVFGQHNTAHRFPFFSLSPFPRKRLLSVDPPSIYLSVCLFLQTFFASFLHHSWCISRPFHIIRDVIFAHFASSFSLHCLLCLFTFLAQNNQPFYLSYFRSGYIKSRLAGKPTLIF